MTTQESKSKGTQPIFRLAFAPYKKGVDQSGQNTLGVPVEIGACWSRKDTSKGLVAKFNIIPENMQESGVLLLMPPKLPENGELVV